MTVPHLVRVDVVASHLGSRKRRAEIAEGEVEAGVDIGSASWEGRLVVVVVVGRVSGIFAFLV